MDRTNLKIFLSRPWVVWTLLGGAVAVSVLLFLAEFYSDRLGRMRWSELWIIVAFGFWPVLSGVP